MTMMMVPLTMGLSSPTKRTFFKRVIVEETPKYFVLETLTIYNPEESQCDTDPLITANNSKIDLDKLRRNEIRWMALSRNLLKRWNGAFNYGDTVSVHSGGCKYRWPVGDQRQHEQTFQGSW